MHGTRLRNDGGFDFVSVKSPDGTKSVSIKIVEDKGELYTTVIVRSGSQRFRTRLDGFRSEILWSPDSRAFAVNQTEGGGGFDQRTYVFYVEQGGLRKVDVSNPVDKAFGSPVRCDAPLLPPNTAILEWLDKTRVLVVAEIVNVSVCACSGSFETYEVGLPAGKVLKRYSQAETKSRFATSLGCEFDGADDACAMKWQVRRHDIR
ncbi:MAG TPA: hypothetical protein VKE93_01425 [Candidatus Angelobacter sp.]|nr:hypothetical protein [Candidatus Angelobacter sp.]